MKATALIELPSPGASDRVEFTLRSDGGMDVRMDNDWYGSTDTGFGATLHVYLDREHVRVLHEFISAHVSAIRSRTEGEGKP